MSFTVKITRIILLFILINFNNNILVDIFVSGEFYILFIFCFGMTYLFSLQIKSAHQSNKLIYSILCKFNMKLSFKLKVKLNYYKNRQ